MTSENDPHAILRWHCVCYTACLNVYHACSSCVVSHRWLYFPVKNEAIFPVCQGDIYMCTLQLLCRMHFCIWTAVSQDGAGFRLAIIRSLKEMYERMHRYSQQQVDYVGPTFMSLLLKRCAGSALSFPKFSWSNQFNHLR